ncbi:MAG: cysteine synthase A, partial [Spirochaetales bacterium]|nr:cysteine synthase A [Spirochaetales bacterium]
MKYNNVLETIGDTPLVKINNSCGNNANVYAKLEYFNPGSSVKDRVAFALVEKGEQHGFIKNDTIIIEPTSGNTGVGLAMVCAVKGYKLILTMPDSVSFERRQILAGFGAELVLTEGSLGMAGAITKAEELAAENKNSWIPEQFKNPANPEAHEKATAVEIWNDTEGKIDIFIAAAGTGGTVSGNARTLKKLNPDIEIIAVEPAGSPVITQSLNNEDLKPGAHKIQGIGAGFIPDNLDLSLIDEVMKVEDQEAIEQTRRLMKE